MVRRPRRAVERIVGWRCGRDAFVVLRIEGGDVKVVEEGRPLMCSCLCASGHARAAELAGSGRACDNNLREEDAVILRVIMLNIVWS